MTITGITADGHQVFDNTIDDIGRRVVIVATTSSAGLLEDGTAYFTTTPMVIAEDTVYSTDATIRGATRNQICFDSLLKVTDAYFKTLPVLIADAALITDAYVKTLLARITGDAEPLSDAIQTSRTTLDDAILFVDAVVKSLSKSLSEAILLFVAVTPQKLQFGLDVGDAALFLSETFSKNLSGIIDEWAELNDEPVKKLLAGIVEALEVADDIDTVRAVALVFAETLLHVLDEFEKQHEAQRDDAIDSSDAIISLFNIISEVIDSLESSDALIFVSDIIRVIADNLLPTDARAASWSTSFSENQTVLDEAGVKRIVTAWFADNVGIRDTMARELAIVFGDDSYDSTEELVKMTTRILLEAMGPTDDIEAVFIPYVLYYAQYLDQIVIGIQPTIGGSAGMEPKF